MASIWSRVTGRPRRVALSVARSVEIAAPPPPTRPATCTNATSVRTTAEPLYSAAQASTRCVTNTGIVLLASKEHQQIARRPDAHRRERHGPVRARAAAAELELVAFARCHHRRDGEAGPRRQHEDRVGQSQLLALRIRVLARLEEIHHPGHTLNRIEADDAAADGDMRCLRAVGRGVVE